MLDLIASVVVRALNLLLHVMPMRLNLWIGRRLGGIVYALSGKRKGITYANLKAAFHTEKTPEEIRRITKDTFRNMAQTFVEILSMTKVTKEYAEQFVDIRNLERIEDAAENPNGMILLSAHFGNWELTTAVSAMKGFPLYIFARDQKMRRLNELLNTLRESTGNIIVRKGVGIKKIFRLLREGKNLGLLADQNAGPTGILLDFFGRPASTATGPYRFAQKSGAWILPVFIHRTSGVDHVLTIERPMKIKKEDDITLYMQEYNNLLEKHIRECPDQWLWMHKKWKLTPVKNVLVLDDGKKGHLKQSLAVVKQIRRYREGEGYDPGDVKLDLVRIHFKSKVRKTICNLFSPLFASGCQGKLGLLRWALREHSYRDAVEGYADVIVSCGSALVGVNSMLKVENNARNVTVFDPGRFNRENFDIVIIPRHDHKTQDMSRESRDDNIIITDLAPNLIDVSELEAFREETAASFLARQSDENKKCIGVLFGGDNPHFSFGDALTRSVAEELKIACEKIDACLYMTTSRRTSGSAEKILQNAFKGNIHCYKLILGTEDKDERTVEKILGRSDVVLVSGESVSMVSEAVASGRPVLVFMPDKKTSRKTKYEKFVEDLQARGYLRLILPDEVSGALVQFSTNDIEYSVPEDNKRIYEKMYKLF